jgi:hypothetical protein
MCRVAELPGTLLYKFGTRLGKPGTRLGKKENE